MRCPRVTNSPDPRLTRGSLIREQCPRELIGTPGDSNARRAIFSTCPRRRSAIRIDGGFRYFFAGRFKGGWITGKGQPGDYRAPLSISTTAPTYLAAISPRRTFHKSLCRLSRVSRSLSDSDLSRQRGERELSIAERSFCEIISHIIMAASMDYHYYCCCYYFWTNIVVSAHVMIPLCNAMRKIKLTQPWIHVANNDIKVMPVVLGKR